MEGVWNERPLYKHVDGKYAMWYFFSFWIVGLHENLAKATGVNTSFLSQLNGYLPTIFSAKNVFYKKMLRELLTKVRKTSQNSSLSRIRFVQQKWRTRGMNLLHFGQSRLKRRSHATNGQSTADFVLATIGLIANIIARVLNWNLFHRKLRKMFTSELVLQLCWL